MRHLPLQQRQTSLAKSCGSLGGLTKPARSGQRDPARARAASRKGAGPPSTYLALSAAGGGQQRSPTAATAATSPPRVGPGACAHVQPGALLPACASQSRRSPSRLRERLTPPAARGPAPAAARNGSAQPPARPVRSARLSPLSSAGAHPTPPRAGAAHWLRRLPGDEQPRPALVQRGLASDNPQQTPSRSPPRSCGYRTCYTRGHPAAAPRPQLSTGTRGGS